MTARNRNWLLIGLAIMCLSLADVRGCQVPSPFSPNAPIAGKSVLILYEAQAPMSEGQEDIIAASPWKEKLSRLGVSWRTKDDDTPTDDEPWAAAIAAGYESLPWLWIGNEATGTSQPLPATLEEFEALLDRYFAP